MAEAATATEGKPEKLKVDKFADANITLLKFSGTIDEEFSGKKLAGTLTDVGSDDKFSRPAYAARSANARVGKQRSDAFGEARGNTIRRYRILSTNVRDDFIEFREG